MTIPYYTLKQFTLFFIPVQRSFSLDGIGRQFSETFISEAWKNTRVSTSAAFEIKMRNRSQNRTKNLANILSTGLFASQPKHTCRPLGT